MKNLIKSILLEYINEDRKPKGFWDVEENLAKAAEGYSTLTQFQKGNQMAYKKAKEKGKYFFDTITSHMVKPRSVNPYTDQELIDIAEKYKTKKEYMTHPSWQVAYKRGKDFYDRITSHMVPLGSKNKRMVYGYFFPKSNAVYIGLTYNIDNRNKQHLVIDVDEKKQTSVGKFINETKEIPKLVKFTKYIDVSEAQKIEGELVKKWKDRGYVILNKIKTGGIGAGYKYTDEELKDIVSQISNIKDLYTTHHLIYRIIQRRGKDFYNEVTKDMERNQTEWSEELVRKLAKNYNSKTEFQSQHPGGTNFAKQNNFWDDLFIKEVPSDNEIISIGSEHDTQEHFRQEHPDLFYIAQKSGLLKQINFKKTKKRGPKLTPEDIIEIAQNYKTLKDFYTNENSAYRRAMKMCKTLGDDFCLKVFSHLR